MKKSVAAYWVFAIGLLLVSSINVAEAEAQVFSQPLSLQSLSSQLESPEAIARYIWRHFTFERDQKQFGREEYWQSPEELLASRKGDCEDFALFAHALLKAAGIRSFLLNVYGEGFAHTVCVFEEDGKYNVIDGTKVLRYRAKNLKELSGKIHPFWKESAIVSPSSQSNSGRILKQIEKEIKVQHRLITSA